VGVEHGLVDARVRTLITLVRLGVEMVAEMVLEVVFVLCDKRAPGAFEHSIVFDMRPVMLPKLDLRESDVTAVLATECLDFSLGVEFGR